MLAMQMVPQPGTSTDGIDNDYQREMFLYAAARVKRSVQPSTWQAFWSVAVLGQSVAEVAAELHISTGAVYIARSRVIARLRREVQRLEADENALP